MNRQNHRPGSVKQVSQRRGQFSGRILGAAACSAVLMLGGAANRLNAQEVVADASAQTGCFMVDASGKTVSLGALCGYSTPSSASPAGGTSTAASGSSSSSTASSGNASNGVVQVPIVRRSGRTPVIAVTFNGKNTYEMILDTGATGTLITARMAKELGVEPNGVVQAEIADGSRVEFLTAQVSSIAVQNAKVNNVNVAIAMDTDIGLLGHDFFGDFDISIREKVVEFSRR